MLHKELIDFVNASFVPFINNGTYLLYFLNFQ